MVIVMVLRTMVVMVETKVVSSLALYSNSLTCTGAIACQLQLKSLCAYNKKYETTGHKQFSFPFLLAARSYYQTLPPSPPTQPPHTHTT